MTKASRCTPIVVPTLAVLLCAALVGASSLKPASARDGDPVDRARAVTKHRELPKAKPGAVGTPPVITKPGASVPATPAPSKARSSSYR